MIVCSNPLQVAAAWGHDVVIFKPEQVEMTMTSQGKVGHPLPPLHVVKI